MSRGDVLMRKIREDIAVIDNQKDAKTKKQIDTMEDALMALTRHISALGDIPNEEVLPHKDELVGIMGMMDTLTNKIELAKVASREAILEIIHKIKAQNSYKPGQE